MPAVIVLHDVDDVDHWLSSPKREELFGQNHRAHVPRREASNHVGLVAEIPDMAVWQETLESETGAEAMKFDGVRPETIRILMEG